MADQDQQQTRDNSATAENSSGNSVELSGEKIGSIRIKTIANRIKIPTADCTGTKNLTFIL